LETTFPGGIRTKMSRLPVLIRNNGFGLRNDPPAEVGRDSETILADLGYSADEIQVLAQRKVIRTAS